MIPGVLELIGTIGGLVVPPAFDFIKKVFVKPDSDSEIATVNTLATTKPEVLADYTAARATLINAQIAFFNRDVVGQPSQWVVDLRSSIRPCCVALALVTLALTATPWLDVPAPMRASLLSIVSSWLGDRLNKSSA